MVSQWTWETAGARERGWWVRDHARSGCQLGEVCRLFHLTESGAESILRGADWKPEYEQASVNELDTLTAGQETKK
jgi:hypothetical protein